MVAYVVSFEVGVDIGFEVFVIFGEDIAHVDYGVGFVFEPVDEGLVKFGSALEFIGDIALSE